MTPVFIDDCQTERSHQYWPIQEGESKSFRHISITKLSKETLRKDNFKRKLVITSTNKNMVLKVIYRALGINLHNFIILDGQIAFYQAIENIRSMKVIQL